MNRIISGWIVATSGLAWAAVLAATGAQAQTFVADEIRTPYPDDTVIIRRGPYGTMPPGPMRGYGGYVEGTYDEALPPFEVVRIVRATGFEPLGPPVRRRWVYTISAINPQGDDGRVVLDARTGRIMRFVPAAVSDAEVVGSYGPPGAPPPAVRPQPQKADVRTLRPPLPVPRVASRAPQAQPPAPAAARPEPHTVGAAPPAQQASAQPKAVEAKPTEIRPGEAKPSVQLQPTQAMPPVQGLE